jgi:Molecular chaperone
VGHAATSVYVAAFTKEKLQIIAQTHERVLGTRDFDWALLEFCAKTFKEQNGIDIMTNAKARLRLLDVIEKQRKILSANTEATINVEYLAEDLDLNLHVTREQFEKLSAHVLDKFRATLERLKAGKNTFQFQFFFLLIRAALRGLDISLSFSYRTNCQEQ